MNGKQGRTFFDHACIAYIIGNALEECRRDAHQDYLSSEPRKGSGRLASPVCFHSAKQQELFEGGASCTGFLFTSFEHGEYRRGFF